ncbi:MAG: HAD family hydrolase [Sphingomonadaceae bacterium]
MTRPLLITDCDEVLLHMVSHFGAWLDEDHAIDFAMTATDFAGSLTRRDCGTALAREEVWPLLDGFFQTEMDRQTLVPGAAEALARLSETADVVVLTNLRDEHQEARAEQLRALGIEFPVFTNQGGKGEPVVRIVAQYAPSITVFVDDLPQHHNSVSRHAPDVWRLHMIAEPMLAERMPPAPDAHARIDDWVSASAWIADRFAGKPL